MGKLRKKIEAAKKRIAAKKELFKAIFQDAESRLSTQSSQKNTEATGEKAGQGRNAAPEPVNSVNLCELCVEKENSPSEKKETEETENENNG